MDMFTILILFLIKSYSAEGTLLTLPADLHLPYSNSSQSPRVAVQILLTATTIMVDGEPVREQDEHEQRKHQVLEKQCAANQMRLNDFALQLQARTDVDDGQDEDRNARDPEDIVREAARRIGCVR